MAALLEYVGCVHIFLGPYRGNPIALYLRRTESGCQIGPKVYPWNDVMGVGETPNKAAADFEEKWKARGLTADMYSGPAWEGGIKPEKPAPARPAASPKPASSAVAPPPTNQSPSAPPATSDRPSVVEARPSPQQSIQPASPPAGTVAAAQAAIDTPSASAPQPSGQPR